MRRSEWESWWELWLRKWEFWLQRDVEDVWLFVWRKDRFLWQSRSRTNRFRRHVLLKTLRFWAFQTLTNRCLLIDCRQEVDDDVRLICSRWARLTSVKILRESTAILVLRQIKWSWLFSKHALKIMNCKIELRDRFSKHWCRCCERSEQTIWCSLRGLWYDLRCRYSERRALWWDYLLWCCSRDSRRSK